MFCAAFAWNFAEFSVIAFVVVFGMVLVYLLVRHQDTEIKRRRYGFFVERDRYDNYDEEKDQGYPPPPEAQAYQAQASEKNTQTKAPWPISEHGWPNDPPATEEKAD
jgi:hypothetical protein